MSTARSNGKKKDALLDETIVDSSVDRHPDDAPEAQPQGTNNVATRLITGIAGGITGIVGGIVGGIAGGIAGGLAGITGRSAPVSPEEKTAYTKTTQQPNSPPVSDRNEGRNNELTGESREKKESSVNGNGWVRDTSSDTSTVSSSIHTVVAINQPQEHKANNKNNNCLFRFYQLHGFGGNFGETFYSFFTFMMGIGGMNPVFLALMDSKPNSLVLKITIGFLTSLSFVANAFTFSPTAEAKKLVEAYEKNPNNTLLNTAKENKRLSLQLFISFFAGSYANVDQLNDPLKENIGDWKVAVMVPALYAAMFYYIFFNAQDCFDANKVYNDKDYESLGSKTRKAIKDRNPHEAASTLYVNAQVLITVIHRVASFAYLGYKIAQQNGLDDEYDIGPYVGAAIAAIATWPVSKFTRGPAIEERFGYYHKALVKVETKAEKTALVDDYERKYQEAKTVYEARPLSKKLLDEAQYLLLSPNLFLHVPIAYYSFTSVASANQHTLNEAEASTAAALTSAGAVVLTHLFFRQAAKRQAIVSTLPKIEVKDEEKNDDSAEPPKKPNRCASVTAYVSNAADQFLRAIGTVASVLVLADYDIEDPELKANFDLVFLTLCVSMFISAGNWRYQSNKCKSAFPEVFPRLFARKDTEAQQALLDKEVSSDSSLTLN